MNGKWILTSALALVLLVATAAVALSWSPVDPVTGAGPDAMVSLPLDGQSNPAAAYNSDHDQYLVVWADSRPGTSDQDIYGQIFSSSGIPQGDNFPVSDAVSRQTDPFVAYNATDHNYLVAWRDLRNPTNWDVYGQIVNADGTLSGANVDINTDEDAQYIRDLIYDPNANHYLVVWVDAGDDRVEGQLLDNTGGLIGTNAFPIAAGGDDPRATYNSHRNSYMVVYKQGGDISGQAIAADGTLSGSAFVICDDAAAQSYPNLAFNANTQEYLVAWQDMRNDATNGTDIYGQRMDQDGNPQGGEIAISDAADDQHWPDVAYNSRVNQWFVAWHDYRNEDISGMDVYGQRVLSGGGLAGQGNVAIYDGPNNQYDVALAARPHSAALGAEYLAVWADQRSGDGWEVMAQRVGALLGTLNWHDVNVSAPLESQENPRVAYNPADQQFLVAWQDEREGDSDIYAQIVLTNGIPITDNIVVTEGTSNATHAAVAYNATDNEYLIVWENEVILGIYGQLVGAQGSPIGSAFPVFAEAGVRGEPAVAYNAGDNEYFVVFADGGPGSRDVLGTRVDADGDLVRSDFPICAEGDDQYHIDVAHNATDNTYLVVWEDLRDDQGDIYGRLMDADGDPSAAEFVIAQAADAQGHPTAAWNEDDNEYLVVWHDYRDSGNTGSDIYGQRLSNTGALEGDNVRLSSSTALDFQQFPRVQYISAYGRYFVTWQDDRNASTGWDIYGQNVNSDGRLYMSNVPFFTFSGYQQRPDAAFSTEANRGLTVWQDGRNGDTFKIYGRLKEPRFAVYLPLVLRSS